MTVNLKLDIKYLNTDYKNDLNGKEDFMYGYDDDNYVPSYDYDTSYYGNCYEGERDAIIDDGYVDDEERYYYYNNN